MRETQFSNAEIKKRKNTRIYLIVCSIIFGMLILPSLPMIMMSAMMFDSPGSTESTTTWVIFWSMIAYPFVTVLTIITAWILYARKLNLPAIITASLPMLNIIIGILAVVYLSIFCDGQFSC
ncbi:hypothetical protein U6A24_03755 [Aquimarina gracilis]|uniref:Uncharacterized protein n=1 Tax=Aquimarina gracilis TaxID=874422 RepID=A0ABU5ZR58_9FLAO|nr:hypothetical protein [Aquimarina gracilis]MEB3344560.1 hypothetical protein [Aquimarina gracilis]